ncbi:hypothetical protein GHX79_00770 [Salmonella enterica]|nr:hypothetical protein [Salmonella enterica]
MDSIINKNKQAAFRRSSFKRIARGSFSITTYYPPEPPLKHLLNPFRKNDIPQVPEFTIGMLIASARAGRWLYD